MQLPAERGFGWTSVCDRPSSIPSTEDNSLPLVSRSQNTETITGHSMYFPDEVRKKGDQKSLKTVVVTRKPKVVKCPALPGMQRGSLEMNELPPSLLKTVFFFILRLFFVV